MFGYVLLAIRSITRQKAEFFGEDLEAIKVLKNDQRMNHGCLQLQLNRFTLLHLDQSHVASTYSITRKYQQRNV